MFRLPVTNLLAAIALFILIFMLAFVQVGLIQTAFAKLGLSPNQGFLLLMAVLFGSGVNVPLYKTGRTVEVCLSDPGMLFRHVRPQHDECKQKEDMEQYVAVNLGGCLIPLMLCAYLIQLTGLHVAYVVVTTIVSVACFKLARPVSGIGIGIPLFIPPIITALAAITFAPTELQAPVAFVSGVVGTLIGADILHLTTDDTMRELNAPALSVGGAGTFDGIFITAIIAVLLA